MWLPPADYPAIASEENRVHWVILGEVGERVQHLRYGERVPDEIEELRRKQIDDFRFDVAAA